MPLRKTGLQSTRRIGSGSSALVMRDRRKSFLEAKKAFEQYLAGLTKTLASRYYLRGSRVCEQGSNGRSAGGNWTWTNASSMLRVVWMYMARKDRRSRWQECELFRCQTSLWRS